MRAPARRGRGGAASTSCESAWRSFPQLLSGEGEEHALEAGAPDLEVAHTEPGRAEAREQRGQLAAHVVNAGGEHAAAVLAREAGRRRCGGLLEREPEPAAGEPGLHPELAPRARNDGVALVHRPE